MLEAATEPYCYGATVTLADHGQHREIQPIKYLQKPLEDQTSLNCHNSGSTRTTKIDNRVEVSPRSWLAARLVLLDLADDLARIGSKEGAIEENNVFSDDAHGATPTNNMNNQSIVR